MSKIIIHKTCDNPYLYTHAKRFIGVEVKKKPTIKEKIKNYFKRFKKEQKVMKFKVGDKVRIKKPGSYRNNMVAVITKTDYESITDKLGYQIRVGNEPNPDRFVWFDEELELIECAVFTKSDLKDGMVVEYRNGSREMVFGSRSVDTAGYHRLDDYSESLTEEKYHFPNHAIDKVYTVNSDAICNFNDVFKDEYLTLIWERKEEKKEPKYKVGDKVKMREDLATGKFEITVWPEMAKMAGKVTTIKKEFAPGYSYIIDDASIYAYTWDMIEGIVDYEEMTVAEIEKKLGYKVKIVDGE